MEIIQAILKDHQRHSLLMNTLVETSGDTLSRKYYSNELKELLIQHAIAEESYFYAP